MPMPEDIPAITPVDISSGGGRFSGLFAERKAEEGVATSSSKADHFRDLQGSQACQYLVLGISRCIGFVLFF